MVLPRCAQECALVAYLLAEIARLKGTTVAVQYVTHGLALDDDVRTD